MATPWSRDADLALVERALRPGECGVIVGPGSPRIRRRASLSAGRAGRVICIGRAPALPAFAGRIGGLARVAWVAPGGSARIDALVRDDEAVGLIRCPRDGSELAVLLGAERALAGAHPTVICTPDPARGGDAGWEDLLLLMARHGYAPYDYVPTSGGLTELHIGDRPAGALVFIHPLRLDRFR